MILLLTRMRWSRTRAWGLVLSFGTRLVIRELAFTPTLALFTPALAAAFLLPSLALWLLLGMALGWMLALRSLFARVVSLRWLRFPRRAVRVAMLDSTTTGNPAETLRLALFGWHLWRGVFLTRLGAFLAFAHWLRWCFDDRFHPCGGLGFRGGLGRGLR
jgi:hypothetical protein